MRTLPEASRPFGELVDRGGELAFPFPEGKVSLFLNRDRGKASLGGFAGLLDPLWSHKSSVPDFYRI